MMMEKRVKETERVITVTCDMQLRNEMMGAMAGVMNV